MADINYNEIHKIKSRLEELYELFRQTHMEYLKIIEDMDCLDREKIDQIHTNLMEIEAEIDKIYSNFYAIQSKNKIMMSHLSEVRLLKKARLTKIESNMRKGYGAEEEEDGDILPF